MTEAEYNELEARLEKAAKLKAMQRDMEQAKRETQMHRMSQSVRATANRERAFAAGGGGTGSAKSAGGLFQRIQIKTEG